MAWKDLFRTKSVTSILQEAKDNEADANIPKLNKHLGVRDLTFFGIAAVIGTGVFTSIGSASANGGPGVVLLFIFTAIACAFAAYCYAEFASMVPISGSAYTYAYVAFGELFAWIIGWDLLMEYAIGNIAVAISWSDYFTNLLRGVGVHLPDWITMDYFTAKNAYAEAVKLLSNNVSLDTLDTKLQAGYAAWQNAPNIAGLRLIMDIPALMIVVLITYIVFIGIKESKRANNIMVFTKLTIIFLVIVFGAYYVHPENWSPFAPNGLSGIMKGVSAVFFAYIGFDAISTTAEECKEPQKDLPKSMFYTLIICTTLYVLLVIVLTGMVHYTKLNVADPLAFVFAEQGTSFSTVFASVVSVSAIVVIASVLLIFQLGQPRIWMSMSRDGLLPKAFSKIHPKYKTPSFATIVTGLVVAIPALFLNLDIVISLCSIGTLFAFVLVCGGILVLQNSKNKPESKFKTPYINGKYIVPAIFILAIVLSYIYIPNEIKSFFSLKSTDAEVTTTQLILEKIPMLLFVIVCIIMTILTFIKNLSLIPVLGLLSCFYLMCGESYTNWLRFLIWLIIGLFIYFLYSRSRSKLSNQ